ncbi:MAG: glycosyltransferase family 1 protein [Acidimicrobiia bacterium]|nr:glycosyltransferase family 1 protein [Acidimicrobiia bacterium]
MTDDVHADVSALDRCALAAVVGRDIAVNLLWCLPGRVGGSEEYLARQLAGLGALMPSFLPTLYGPRGYPAAHPDLAARFTIAAGPPDGGLRSLRILGEHSWLANRTRGADLVHHGGGTVPAIGTRPTVLTVHDLQYLAHPEYHRALKLRYLSAAIPRSVQRADVVTVPTEWVRSTVIEAFGVDPDDVVVVRHGITPPVLAAGADEPELRERFGLGDGPVVVLPAITHPHKGHRFLLEVMARHWVDPDLRLVLLGGRGTADASVEAAIDEFGLRSRVIRPGRVPDADRDGLIALSQALVFPSEYEGFGAPVVEAMALGTPVICTDHPALAEVVGPAGLVLPRSLDAWADALAEVDRCGPDLVAAGVDRAARFTSERSGADLATAYQRALEAAA